MPPDVLMSRVYFLQPNMKNYHWLFRNYSMVCFDMLLVWLVKMVNCWVECVGSMKALKFEPKGSLPKTVT